MTLDEYEELSTEEKEHFADCLTCGKLGLSRTQKRAAHNEPSRFAQGLDLKRQLKLPGDHQAVRDSDD
jgi:hypothetical protein